MVLIIEGIWSYVLPYIPNLIFIVFLVVLLFLTNVFINKFFKRIFNKLGRKYGLVLGEMGLKFILYAIIIILILINIPGVNESVLQMLGLIGAGIVAFSSSTIIANALSGLLIKIIRPYHLGEVIRVGEYFGKVAEIKVLHTELETHTKKILSVPNALIMKGAVKNFSRAPPMVHSEVTLGYDLDRLTAEKLLMNAARKAGLTHPFVAIIKLNDFSITYQVNGELIQRPEQFNFVESNLRKIILDEFALAQKEIMSPEIRMIRSAPRTIVPKITPELKKALKKKQAREKIIARILGAEVFEEAEAKARKAKREMAQKIRTLHVPKKEEEKKKEKVEKAKAAASGKTIIAPTLRKGITPIKKTAEVVGGKIKNVAAKLKQAKLIPTKPVQAVKNKIFPQKKLVKKRVPVKKIVIRKKIIVKKKTPIIIGRVIGKKKRKRG